MASRSGQALFGIHISQFRTPNFEFVSRFNGPYSRYHRLTVTSPTPTPQDLGTSCDQFMPCLVALSFWTWVGARWCCPSCTHHHHCCNLSKPLFYSSHLPLLPTSCCLPWWPQPLSKHHWLRTSCSTHWRSRRGSSLSCIIRFHLSLMFVPLLSPFWIFLVYNYSCLCLLDLFTQPVVHLHCLCIYAPCTFVPIPFPSLYAWLSHSFQIHITCIRTQIVHPELTLLISSFHCCLVMEWRVNAYYTAMTNISKWLLVMDLFISQQ